MKVELPGPHEPRPPAEARAATRARPREAPAAPGGAGGVELSGTAQAFLRLRPQLDGAAGTIEREARITHLRDEIASGGYRVNGEQIAAAMLRDDAIAAMLGFPRR